MPAARCQVIALYKVEYCYTTGYYVITLRCYATTVRYYATTLRYYATTLRYYVTILRYYAITRCVALLCYIAMLDEERGVPARPEFAGNSYRVLFIITEQL